MSLPVNKEQRWHISLHALLIEMTCCPQHMSEYDIMHFKLSIYFTLYAWVFKNIWKCECEKRVHMQISICVHLSWFASVLDRVWPGFYGDFTQFLLPTSVSLRVCVCAYRVWSTNRPDSLCFSLQTWVKTKSVEIHTGGCASASRVPLSWLSVFKQTEGLSLICCHSQKHTSFFLLPISENCMLEF